MVSALILLFLWLFILWFAANHLINSSVRIAKYFKVSALFIGLTVLAFGTSAPELFLSAMAAINGNWSLSVWNVIGSNIFNLWFILGLSAIIAPILIQKKLVYRDGFFLLFITALITFMLWDQVVMRWEWAILLLLLVWYNAYLWIKREAPTDEPEISSVPKVKHFIRLFVWVVVLSIIGSRVVDGNFQLYLWSSIYWDVFLAILVLLFSFALFKKEIPHLNKNSKWIFLTVIKLIASLWLLVLASNHVVNAAVYIAHFFGVSERAIWATIVAAGTSLPEIAATVAAIIKKNYDMWVWNVIWSDIFNILWVLWISSVITPLKLAPACLFLSDCNAWFFSMLFRDNMFSLIVLFLTLIITFIFMRTGWRLSKTEWIFLFSFAVLRMVFEINPNFFVSLFWW